MKKRMLTLDDVVFEGQRVLVRIDLNLPMQDGHVTDDTRVQRVLPTIHELCEKGAKIILISHFGRPKGKKKSEYSLEQILPTLQALLPKQKVDFFPDCQGEATEKRTQSLKNGECLLLENVRFYPQEEKNEDTFSRNLAKLADIYVNDAFSAAHRAHSSTEGVTRFMKTNLIGRAMQKEVETLESVIAHPQRPVLAIIGGAKISTKIQVILHLMQKVDAIFIAGGMANTFLLAQGKEIGSSLCEKEQIDTAKMILENAKKSSCRILLPQDYILAKEMKANAPCIETEQDCPPEYMILDIGTKTQIQLKEEINHMKTLLWNGPLGLFEIPPFHLGTHRIARHIAKRVKEKHLIAVGGGGDTLAAIASANVTDDFTYLSVAGGAFLEWLEGKTLPAISALYLPSIQ